MTEPRTENPDRPTPTRNARQIAELPAESLTPEQEAKVKGGIGGVGDPQKGKLATN